MARARKAKASKKNYMSNEAFGALRGALEDAHAYERGERPGLRMTRVAVPRPPAPVSREEIVKIRRRLNCSQSVFAMILNVSPRTVQAWEQGTREPSDAALKLLSIADKHPEVLLES